MVPNGRLSLTVRADTVDDHVDIAQGIALGKLGSRQLHIGETEQLATAQTAEVGVWRVGRVVGDTKAPDPIVGGDAVGKTPLQ